MIDRIALAIYTIVIILFAVFLTTKTDVNLINAFGFFIITMFILLSLRSLYYISKCSKKVL